MGLSLDEKAEILLRGGDIREVEARLRLSVPSDDDWSPPTGPEEYGLSDGRGLHVEDAPPLLPTQTPAAWRGTEVTPQRWLADGRIPAGDLTIYAGNGGAGKTETAVQLLVSVSAGLGDWLGAVVERGPVLFLSCEEPEDNIRGRVERYAKHRNIDPYDCGDLHLSFPELDASWLVSVDRNGAVNRSRLFEALENWVRAVAPALIVIDSIAAVFDGEAIARRQVRTFLAMLRKLSRETGTAIVLLDHPSVRGMADGSGTANSVDWRNSVRSMLHLSDPDKDDPDARVLEVKKSNYGRNGEKVTIRWNGLTFVPDDLPGGGMSPQRAAAEAQVDTLFLRLLEQATAQGRILSSKPGRNSAGAIMAAMPDAGNVKATALQAAMERLLKASKISVEMAGPPSRRQERLVVGRREAT